MANLPVPDDATWRDLRAKHIGASEVAALFNLSPWLTRWQLYMLKTGRLPDVFDETMMMQGRHFEPAIASYAQEKFDIKLRKVRRYLVSDDTAGMGASLDYEEYGSGSLIPTEIKWSIWGEGWDWEGEELTTIPDYYMLQVQHQMACADAEQGQLVAFTGGDLKRMLIPRNERLVGAVKAAVTQFWEDVAAGNEPPVDFKSDGDAIGRMAHVARLRTLVMTTENEPLFKRWDEARALAKQAGETADACKAEVLKTLMDTGEGNDEGVRVTCADWKVSVSKIAENPGREIVPADVGTRVGAKRGYLRAVLKNTKEKE